MKNRQLSKAIHDVNWGELTRQLEYKAAWYGRTVVKISQWFPSTKRCSDCRHIMKSLKLSVRNWRCPECGVEHDRDINAARNIKAEGHSVLASGDNVNRK
jgi:putative transposase